MTPKEAYEKCIKENKRIPELEKIIANNSLYSYQYAYYIIKGPWELGEEAIIKDLDLSLLYAKYIIYGPFKKCHPYIFNSEYRENYINFLKSINCNLNKIAEWLI